jgi:hypothetical protein
MDLVSLELETQTLIRKVQVLAGESHSMQAMIQMYETSLQGQDKDKARTQCLEEELHKVSCELKKQLPDRNSQDRGQVASKRVKFEAETCSH